MPAPAICAPRTAITRSTSSSRPTTKTVALEVKLSDTIDDDDVKHLHWLKQQIRPLLMDAAVLNTGQYAYRRKDGIAVIPLALLGP